jgi:hypothetical protein
MSKFIAFSFGLIIALLIVRQDKLSADRRKSEIKAKISEKQLISCVSKYRRLLTYENDNFKKRVEKFCPCIDKK